jgi:polysaccharide pyruvyl transferase WcaK-like protein
MRLALLNLRYSPNLGDVLLCECLEFGIRKAAPTCDVLQIDITGRQAFAAPSSRRLAALAVLQRLPQTIRRVIARVVLGRSLRRIAPTWRKQFETVDAAVLGGGNLLADADLNFPLKIAAIMQAVAARGIPAAVFGIGVSDNWSRPGRTLFQKALGQVRLVDAAVRDPRSKTIWERRLGPAVATPRIVRDPGFLTADCFPRLPKPAATGRRVGLCMTHPVALSYHADEAVPQAAAMTEWFREAARAFSARGDTVLLFTTGSPEDGAYIEEIGSSFDSPAGGGAIQRVPRFESAAAMAGFISTLDLVIAHRLHACIAAYTYGVPHIGLTWDRKMLAFFESVERSGYLVSPTAMTTADVMTLADRACGEGIDGARRDQVIGETHRDIAILLQKLNAA